MTFRVLKFRPHAQPPAAAASGAAAPAAPRRMRPVIGHDNGWWWEGVARGELLIQKCEGCGALRHPPRAMCGECQSIEWTSIRPRGAGTVYSYTVLHHPKFPGYEYPLVCAVIELEEGTRLVSNLVGCAPADVRIGMAVQLSFERVDDDTTLPFFRPVRS
jgi:uncharacterized OB-fold protein